MSSEQEVLRVEPIARIRCCGGTIVTARTEHRRASRISKVRAKYRVAQVLTEIAIHHRAQHLDASIEVAFHQIGAADVGLRIAAVLEPVDSRVFEKPAND